MEIFKDIIGYQGLYKISNYGNIKSLNYGNTKKEKVLKKRIVSKKFRSRFYNAVKVALYKNKKAKYFQVSRLVYESFKGKIPNGYEIDHVDNDPQNNKLDNLQAVTRSENDKKKFIDNPKLLQMRRKKIKCLNNNKVYNSLKEASSELNISMTSISESVNNKRILKYYKFKFV